MAATTNHTSVEKLNAANLGKLPEHLGLTITEVAAGRVAGRLTVRPDLVAHTGYLLAGVVLGVADLLCAYGVSTAWPEGASGFTTAEAKCNFIGTAREGEVTCIATLLHGGRTTQVWDAEMIEAATGRRMASFRCTQIILYPRTDNRRVTTAAMHAARSGKLKRFDSVEALMSDLDADD